MRGEKKKDPSLSCSRRVVMLCCDISSDSDRDCRNASSGLRTVVGRIVRFVCFLV